MFKMDKKSVQLLVALTWIAQFTTGASDWKELDSGISSSVVKTHFIQLQDASEMETETNFPPNFQHSGEVNYINRAVVDLDILDDNVQDVKQVFKENKQDENQQASTAKTLSSEETGSEEYSEEDTEKPLASTLLGTNVRFTVSAEDERYTKRKFEIYEPVDEEENTESSKSMPSMLDHLISSTENNGGHVRVQTATSKTISEMISSVKLIKPVTLVTNTRSISYSFSTHDQSVNKMTNSTNPTTEIPSTSLQPPVTTTTIMPIDTTKLTVRTNSNSITTANAATILTSAAPKLTTSFPLSSTQEFNQDSTIQNVNVTTTLLNSSLNLKPKSISQSTAIETTTLNTASEESSSLNLVTESHFPSISTKTPTTTRSTTEFIHELITPFIPSTSIANGHRPTIRSRLARPKMLPQSFRKTSKLLTTTTNSNLLPEELEAYTIKLTPPSINGNSSSKIIALSSTSKLDTSSPIPTPSLTEPTLVMTLLKDMTADYPLDVPPDIETFYNENDRKQSPSPTMSASTTNTIVISSIIGGCAILFFALLMIFYMWKQRKVRRRRKRPIPQMSLTKPNYNWQFGQTYDYG